ncbi:M23 family metallopeptidase [Nocardiaceae bacterium YC2-7]|uniref:M23 family metallopeptidase n=1 Tax=Antrihabitans stalactiti TaxID=2584121 RepID=A0A848K3I1_9NOCA|nr:M23 family metallopeptidase [Antrihabitans stalactiti]
MNPDPIPVKGSDGKVHVSYELAVLNTAPRDATITLVETLADGADGKVVATIDRDEVVARSVIVGDYKLPPIPAATLPAGRTMLLVIDDAYAERSDVPAKFVNRLASTRAIAARRRGAVRHRLVQGGPRCQAYVRRRRWARHVPWRPHSQRELPGLRSAAACRGGWNGGYRCERRRRWSASGDSRRIDGRRARRDHVVIDIGDGRYAFYAHIKGGSVKVKPGDKVTKGQEIARLGNTGSATEAHLHFQVMAGTQPLTAMNQPSQFEKFTLQGTAESDGFVPATDAGPRTDELLLIRSVISFP